MANKKTTSKKTEYKDTPTGEGRWVPEVQDMIDAGVPHERITEIKDGYPWADFLELALIECLSRGYTPKSDGLRGLQAKKEGR